MRESLGHAATLRIIGRMFDFEEASSITIDEGTGAVLASWGAPNGSMKTARYQWSELDILQDVAELNRANQPPKRPAPASDLRGWGELLRTVGQDLDHEDAVASSITGDPDWLSAAWISGGQHRSRHYTTAELWDSSRRRAEARSPVA